MVFVCLCFCFLICTFLHSARGFFHSLVAHFLPQFFHHSLVAHLLPQHARLQIACLLSCFHCNSKSWYQWVCFLMLHSLVFLLFVCFLSQFLVCKHSCDSLAHICFSSKHPAISVHGVFLSYLLVFFLYILAYFILSSLALFLAFCLSAYFLSILEASLQLACLHSGLHTWVMVSYYFEIQLPRFEALLQFVGCFPAFSLAHILQCDFLLSCLLALLYFASLLTCLLSSKLSYDWFACFLTCLHGCISFSCFLSSETFCFLLLCLLAFLLVCFLTCVFASLDAGNL